MTKRIRQDDVQAVRERSDIARVISEYLQLKKAGRDSLVGVCPFHPEKTPSFSVSPSKQLYHCFGCGEGGDVFRFLQKMENLSFVEAVERLGASVGVALRYEGETAGDRRASGKRNLLQRANEEAARLFNGMLRQGREAAEARAYLASREISEESIDRFQIGFAPSYPDFLLRRMSKTYSPETLVEAGLAIKDASGAVRDRFRGRVMFPVRDMSGNAVGFGGRLVAGSPGGMNVAKYVNSPDTAIYHKGGLLYNLDRAKREITRSDRAFLVEGYTDVIALDQAGIATAVATCGTALGEDHVRLLARFCERVVLAFDSDEAGARAAERAYSFHQAYSLDLQVLVLPQGQDPADFVKDNGGDAFLALAAGAVPLVQYMLERSLAGRDLSDVEARTRALREGVGLLVRIQDPVRRQEYAPLLAEGVGVSVGSVLLEIERASAPGTGGPAPVAARMPPAQKVEREALKLMVQAPEVCAPRLDGLGTDRFSTPGYRRAFELILDNRADLEAPDAARSLVAAAQERGEPLGRLLAALAVEPPETGVDSLHEYAERVFLRLDEFHLSRQIDAMRKQLERLNPMKVPGDYNAMFERLVGLEGARRRVRMAAESLRSPA